MHLGRLSGALAALALVGSLHANAARADTPWFLFPWFHAAPTAAPAVHPALVVRRHLVHVAARPHAIVQAQSSCQSVGCGRYLVLGLGF